MIRLIRLLPLLLAACDASRSSAALLRALDATDVKIRCGAVREAESLDRADALRVLRAALANDEAEVRREAARALGRMGRRAAEALPDLLRLQNDSEACLDVEEAIRKIRPHPGSGRPPGRAFVIPLAEARLTFAVHASLT